MFLTCMIPGNNETAAATSEITGIFRTLNVTQMSEIKKESERNVKQEQTVAMEAHDALLLLLLLLL